MDRSRRLTLLAAAALGFVTEVPAAATAAQLEVGPDLELRSPSAAARIAKDGDTVIIHPGKYFDCGVWRANGLTISGAGDGVVITDKTCLGKALFVIDGNDVTVRNLTFTRARVPDGNGAGIRAEGRNLTVVDSRFVNNESGILAGENPDSRIEITNTEFLENGACRDEVCSPALRVGRIALLRVSHSQFLGTKLAHAVSSAALINEFVGDTIEDGSEGTSSYLIDLPLGGTIRLTGDMLEKGPRTSNPRTAIMVGDGGELWPSAEITATGNRFTNDTGRPAPFILNWTRGSVVLTDNVIIGNATPISTGGSWVHRARVVFGDLKAGVRHIGGAGLRLVKRALSGLRQL